MVGFIGTAASEEIKWASSLRFRGQQRLPLQHGRAPMKIQMIHQKLLIDN